MNDSDIKRAEDEMKLAEALWRRAVRRAAEAKAEAELAAEQHTKAQQRYTECLRSAIAQTGGAK